MKRPLYSSDANYDARQLKRLKEAKFPHRIQALPHVLKRIDLFSTTPEHAAVEAAASNDIDWLRTLLPQIGQDKDHVGCAATDVAAAHGHHEAIKTIFKWWVEPGYKPQQMCKQALMNAVEGGHVGAVKVLLARWEELDLDGDDWYYNHNGKHSPYNFDMVEALEEAVKSERDDVVRVICEQTENPRQILNWAARHGNVHVFRCIYGIYGKKNPWDVFHAMSIAIGSGYLGIVKFVMGESGAELREYFKNGSSYGYKFPLVCAIKHGKRDIVGYLYERKRYQDKSLVAAFCAAAQAGSMELVKMLNGSRDFGPSALNDAFASAAEGGQLEMMTHLQSHQKFDQTAIDKALETAAGRGQLEAVKYLSKIEGYEMSSAFLDKAFERAGGSHRLEILQYLNTKGEVSRKAVNNAFEYTAFESDDDQARVLKFLFNKGCVSPEVISEGFSDAASSCRLDIIEFLYSKGSISPELVDKAFQEATSQNCAEVVEFLYKTGFVRPKSVEKAFVDAAERGDLYVMESLFSCGFESKALLRKAWCRHSAKELPHRVLRFLTQKQHKLEK